MRVRKHTIDNLEIIEFNASAHGGWVIFLHGGPGMLGYMETFCERFSSHCKAVYYEQRGSKQGDDDIGVLDHLRDLERIVGCYSEESKPIIVGHSWGAMLAVLFAGRYPKSLQKVILTGCGPLNKHQENEFQNELNVRFGDRKDYYDSLWNAIDEEKDEDKQHTSTKWRKSTKRIRAQVRRPNPVTGTTKAHTEQCANQRNMSLIIYTLKLYLKLNPALQLFTGHTILSVRNPISP